MGDVDKESGIIEGATGWLGDLLGKDEWKVWEIDVEKVIKHPNYQHIDGKQQSDLNLEKKLARRLNKNILNQFLVYLCFILTISSSDVQ